MKIKKYTQIVNESRWDEDDSLFGRPSYPGSEDDDDDVRTMEDEEIIILEVEE